MRLWGVMRNGRTSSGCLTMFSFRSIYADMAGSLRTLEEAARHNMLIVVECKRCGRVGKFLARDVASHKGWNTSPWAVKFRCEECKGREMKISLEFFDPDPRGAHVIWRPVKVER